MTASNVTTLVALIGGESADCVCHVRSELDIARTRLHIERGAQRAQVSDLARASIGIAASELAWNQWRYAQGGVICAWFYPANAERLKSLVVLKAADEGPGISDHEWALSDQKSSRMSLGLGLPGVRRLMDSFSLVSPLPCQRYGTLVTVSKQG